MGAKVWGTAAVVIAAAAAAGAGIITWEGRVWDEHAQDLASYKEAPVKTVIFTETARTWRTRAFTVEVELLNGLKMVWQGGAEFGLGTKTKASLDLTQGIGAQIAADKSVEGFGDELVIETSMTGTVKPVVWRLNPITYRAPENAFVCQAEAASITGEKIGQDIVARFVLGGWSCRTAEEIAANAPSTESMKDLRAEIRVGEKPIADFTFTSGPFVSGELSGDGTRAAFISARSAGPAPEGKDGKAAQCWDERVELSVTNPKAGGESASEIGLDLTITNLSEAFLTNGHAGDGSESGRCFPGSRYLEPRLYEGRHCVESDRCKICAGKGCGAFEGGICLQGGGSECAGSGARSRSKLGQF